MQKPSLYTTKSLASTSLTLPSRNVIPDLINTEIVVKPFRF